jgi:hypothetical protein
MMKEHTVHLLPSEVHAANIEEKREKRPTPVLEDRFLDLEETQRVAPASGDSSFPVPNPTILSGPFGKNAHTSLHRSPSDTPLEFFLHISVPRGQR